MFLVRLGPLSTFNLLSNMHFLSTRENQLLGWGEFGYAEPGDRMGWVSVIGLIESHNLELQSLRRAGDGCAFQQTLFNKHNLVVFASQAACYGMENGASQKWKKLAKTRVAHGLKWARMAIFSPCLGHYVGPWPFLFFGQFSPVFGWAAFCIILNGAFGKGVPDQAFHVELPRGIPFEFCN